jgi:hypothetical protein
LSSTNKPKVFAELERDFIRSRTPEALAVWCAPPVPRIFSTAARQLERACRLRDPASGWLADLLRLWGRS